MTTDFFHIHTKRCKHAGKDEDAAYIESAIRLGAKQITFTDHAPFPGDPFDSRMDMRELPEYIRTLSVLGERYKEFIRVRIGLEIEYLPSFHEYYKSLAGMPELEVLMIGQHFFQDAQGDYSFHYNRTTLQKEEASGVCDAVISGCETGYFRVIAHPDRMFRRKFFWDAECDILSDRLIHAAAQHHLALEKNLSCMKKGQYRARFWEKVPAHAETVTGYDAHSVAEMEDAFYALQDGSG